MNVQIRATDTASLDFADIGFVSLAMAPVKL